MEDIRDLRLLTGLTQLNLSANAVSQLDVRGRVRMHAPTARRIWGTCCAEINSCGGCGSTTIRCVRCPSTASTSSQRAPPSPCWTAPTLATRRASSCSTGRRVLPQRRCLSLAQAVLEQRRGARQGRHRPPHSKHPGSYLDPQFPSKFSNSNPRWLPPVTKLKARALGRCTPLIASSGCGVGAAVQHPAHVDHGGDGAVCAQLLGAAVHQARLVVPCLPCGCRGAGARWEEGGRRQNVSIILRCGVDCRHCWPVHWHSGAVMLGDLCLFFFCFILWFSRLGLILRKTKLLYGF